MCLALNKGNAMFFFNINQFGMNSRCFKNLQAIEKIGGSLAGVKFSHLTSKIKRQTLRTLLYFQAVCKEKRDDKKIFRDLEEGFEKGTGPSLPHLAFLF